MKKIVGILGMAAVLASGAFAADPAANFVLGDFTGSAEFGVKANFVPEDVEFGMFNSTGEGKIKFGLISAGDKSTSGDGVWGELHIKTDAADYHADLPSVTVDVAKIHLMSGNFEAALNILEPTLEIKGVSAPAATGATVKTLGKAVTGDLKKGFGLELKLVDLFSLNVKFMDKGLNVAAKNQKYGIAADFALDANLVPGLSFNAGVASNFETKTTAFGVSAGYKLGIGDTMYVKPGVAFDMCKVDTAEAVNGLEAGLLFGWGAEAQKPGFKYVADETAEGVSVGFGTDLKDAKSLVIGLYDQSLLGLLGEGFGTLKTGANFVMDLGKKINTVNAGVAYDVTFSPVYIKLGADVQAIMAENVDAKVNYKVMAKLGTTEVIDNTDLYVQYDFADYDAPAVDKDGKVLDVKTNALTIGTKISF